MDPKRFQRLKAAVARELTAEQCLDLEAHLRGVVADRASETSLAERTRQVAAARRCPRCGHDDVVRHGRDKAGRQRFRCRRAAEAGCGRTFNALTGTALARMRKPEKWLEFAERMGAFRSVDDVARSDLGISRLTAWRWRHRLLKAQADAQAAQLGGVVEADETFFRTSYKGHRGWVRGRPPENRPPRYRGGPALRPGLSGEQVPVLTAVDRGGAVIERVLRNRAEIEAALRGRIKPGSVVCSDGLKAYVNVAIAAGSEHRRIKPPRTDWLAKAIGGKPRRPGRLGLGHVNAHHERVKTFVNRGARGVSTRYLPLYLGWLRAMRSPGFEPAKLLRDGLSTPS